MRLDTRWSNLPLLSLNQSEEQGMLHLRDMGKKKEIGKGWKGGKNEQKRNGGEERESHRELKEKIVRSERGRVRDRQYVRKGRIKGKKYVTKRNKNCQHQVILENNLPSRTRYCIVRRIMFSTLSSWLPVNPNCSISLFSNCGILQQFTSRGLTTMSPTFPQKQGKVPQPAPTEAG